MPHVLPEELLLQSAVAVVAVEEVFPLLLLPELLEAAAAVAEAVVGSQAASSEW